MKKFALVLMVLLAIGGMAFAAPKADSKKASSDKLEPLMAPGDLAITAGIGYGLFWGAMDFSAGAEFILGKFMIGETLPLTYGVAAKASYYSWDAGYTDYVDSYLGGGAFGTLHFGLKDMNLPDNMRWLSNVDTYIGLGVGFYSNTWGYTGSTSNEFRLGFRSTAGVSYFITPNIAIVTEGGYYGYYSSGLLGILFKL